MVWCRFFFLLHGVSIFTSVHRFHISFLHFHPSIFFCLLKSVSRGCWSLSLLPQRERRGTTSTGRQSVAGFMYTVKCFVFPCETVIVGMQRLLRIGMSCNRMLAFSSKPRLRLRMTFLCFYARFVLVVIWLIAGL